MIKELQVEVVVVMKTIIIIIIKENEKIDKYLDLAGEL